MPRYYITIPHRSPYKKHLVELFQLHGHMTINKRFVKFFNDFTERQKKAIDNGYIIFQELK